MTLAEILYATDKVRSVSSVREPVKRGLDPEAEK
jgi:hypothetical protein